MIIAFALVIIKRFHHTLRQYSLELEQKNKILQEAWQEVSTSRNQIAQWNKSLEHLVTERTTEIKNLLDHAGQGFLSIDADLKIKSQFSKECISIFGKNISYMQFSKLLYPDDQAGQQLVDDLLQKVIHVPSNKKHLYLDLLPTECTIHDKSIRLDYKLIIEADHKVTLMVIATDISDKRMLEDKVEQERNTLQMVVRATVHDEDFRSSLQEYTDFCSTEIYELIHFGKSLKNICTEIYRRIHTFKGSFGQFYMLDTTSKIHAFETEFSELCSISTFQTAEDLSAYILSSRIDLWIQENLYTLTRIVGPKFLHKDSLLTDKKEKLQWIEKELIPILNTEEHQYILTYVKHLRYKSLHELLNPYCDYVQDMSVNLGKLLTPMIIKGDIVAVDPDQYQGFIKSLIHVFRNMLDHGIECPEDREALGKDVYGNIHCTIKDAGSSIEILLSDDGQGIDVDKVRKKAIELGIHDKQSVSSLSDSQLLRLIFMDKLSTKDTINELSGRGVGLSAVAGEIEKLGGHIEVTTTAGEGTEFIFTLNNSCL